MWPLALAGYGVAIWLVGQAGGWRLGAWFGWLFGLAHFAVALHWLVEPFQIDAARDGWMAPFALVFMAAGLALFWAVAGAAGARRPALFVLALAAAEAVRGVVLTGFPWATPGHVWLDWAPVHLAAVLGAGGLTLLTLGLAAAPALGRWKGAGLAVVVLGCVWGWGHLRAGAPMPEGPGVRLRLVQPDARQQLKWHPDFARAFFLRHLDLTSAPAERRPDLVIWPETAVPFFLGDDRGGLQAIVDSAAGGAVALGIQRLEGLRGYNSLVVVDGDENGVAQIRAVYDKHHLVPFGEYIPAGDLLADWLSIPSFAPKEGYGYTAGPAPGVLALDGLPPFTPLICYEAVFPSLIRQAISADGRPGWLLQVTNDAWFGERAGPFQHLALARLRAVEFGLPLVRVANTGVSALIDARGRQVASLGLNRQGFLDVDLPAALAATPYARTGPWGAVALWLAALGVLFWRRTD